MASLFDEWASICDAPGTSDKAYAAYVSQLQHSGMLKGDDISDRFFRILIVSSFVSSLSNEIPRLLIVCSLPSGV